MTNLDMEKLNDYSKLELATKTEAIKAARIAKEWFKARYNHFADASYVSRTAVAEYILNCQGKSLWKD